MLCRVCLSQFDAERWLSGLKRRIANPLYGVNPYRGFESPLLRHLFILLSFNELSFRHSRKAPIA